MSKMNLSLRLNTALALCLVLIPLMGCAGMTMNGDVYDPYEKGNRGLFDASLKLDRNVIRPIAIGYRDALPQLVRDSIRNFLNNLQSPVIFANDVLQGQVDDAGVTLIRIGMNSTLGLGGLFDPATRFGYLRHPDDFGITLATYGVGEGPYLFVPFLGPSNVRDLAGYGIDFTFDPFFYITIRENFWWQVGRFVLDDIDQRSRTIDALDEIQKSSLDFYATVRSLYHQQREALISHGTPPQNLPNF